MDQIAFTIAEAVKASGVGRTKLYEAISMGRLPARKAGSRTLIMADDLRAYIANLPALKPSKSKASDNGRG